ncbi:MAG TPA: PilZ domain-containing protein [Polyangiaceae bacterium LLY-WYZ-14_1]|nr:PilZ domain-containing protein [Polyangiaceae bacterium LLY-WYZ-14_1]
MAKTPLSSPAETTKAPSPGTGASDAPAAAAKRRARREPVTCLVWLEPIGGGEGGAVARAVDLSPRGVGLVIARPLGNGDGVVVELLITPTKIRLRTTGRVVHSTQMDEDHWRIGVRFDHPPVLVDEVSSEE